MSLLLLLVGGRVAVPSFAGTGRAPRIVQATAVASRAVEVADRAPRIVQTEGTASRITRAD